MSIHKAQKKAPLQKHQMAAWTRQVAFIFKSIVGENCELIGNLERWAKEFAAGHTEKFPQFIEEIEDRLETLTEFADAETFITAPLRLPRTFIGFSSTDIHYYRLLKAQAKHDHIPFNFCDCQIEGALDSEDESYVRRRLRRRIKMAGKYIMLIGQDTRSKRKYVTWEAEVAIEKKCTIIGVNLDKSRSMNPALTPEIIQNVGAIFVPFSTRIIAHALETYEMRPQGDFYYTDAIYQEKGYRLVGNKAVLPSGR